MFLALHRFFEILADRHPLLFAQALAEIAPDVLRWAGAEQARGIDVRETMLQRRVLDAFARAGLVTDHPPVVAFQANTANPHYEPLAGADRALASGDVILLDLWAGVVPRSVLADQTWMGFAGWAPFSPQEVQTHDE